MKHFYAFLAFLFLVSLASKSEAQINVTLTTTNATCNGTSDGTITSAVTGGTPPYIYLWSTGANTANVSGLTSGLYSLTVVDANSDTTFANATINNPPSLNATVVGTNPNCNGGTNGTATATGSGGTGAFTYLWSNTATNSTISNLSAGTYTATVTDANSCTVSGYTILVNPTALAVSVTGTDQYCNTGAFGSATPNPSGGTPPYSYLWSNGATSSTISGLTSGTYTVTITDSNGCTVTGNTVISASNAPTVSVTGTDQDCSTGTFGSATATPSGGTSPYTYFWTTAATTSSISNLSSGLFTVWVTDAKGCRATDNVTISTLNNTLSVTLAGTDPACNGATNGSTTATPSGGSSPLTFAGSNGNTTPIAVGLGAGTFTVTVTDSKSCTASGNITLAAPSALLVSVAGSNPTCNGSTNGSVTTTLSGGTVPYQYLWSTGQSTASVSGLGEGTYTVTATDSKGCTTSNSTTMVDPDSLTLNFFKLNTTCDTCNNGTAKVIVFGGTAGYSYSWDNGFQGDAVNGLSPGIYCVTVSDSLGCSNSDCINVDSTRAACEVSFIYMRQGYKVNFETFSSTNSPSFNYIWNFGDSTYGNISDSVHTYLNAGTYYPCLTILDSDSCSNTFCDTIYIEAFCKSNFTFNQLNACKYSFNSTSTEGNIVSRDWDFGDGTSSKLSNPEHLYVTSGFYLVKLTIYSSDSCSSLSQQYLSVSGCTGNYNGCIFGCVYQDDNSNCLNDAGELHQTNWIIQLFDLNNNQVLTAKPYFYDNCFQFSNVSPGNYILRADPFYYWWEWDVSCPENGDIYVTVDSGVCDTVYFGANTPKDTIGNDLMVAVDPLGTARAGSTQTFTTGTCNMGSVTLSGTLTLIKDPAYFHNYSYPSPIFESGDTLEWNFSDISPGSCFTASSYLYISTSVSWGQTLGYKAIVTPITGDVTPDNNIDTSFVVISGSYDPNDKLVSPMGLGTGGKIKPNLNDLTYTIRFQNTGNDTAFHIYVLDTLDLNVYDFSSLKILRSSHDYNVSFPGNGVILFDFQNVLLPDSNKNEPASHGYIQYNIRLKPGLPLQTEIKNRAEIFFDYNPGVLTNTALNTLDSTMITLTKKPSTYNPSSHVFPNPAGDKIFVTITNGKNVSKDEMAFKILDVVGKERLKVKLHEGINSINTVPLGSGLYFYKIETGNSNTETGKLVIGLR